jgi:HPt (histidine-containing phosphotransfer) domain-containing protein
MGECFDMGTMELTQAALEMNPAPNTTMLAPIDLDHLRRMTLGNRDLETEVLRLFAGQARAMIAELHAAGGEMTPMSVHTIKGSARGVGAHAVAQAAESVERASEAHETRAAVSRLARALDDAKAEIARLLEVL